MADILKDVSAFPIEARIRSRPTKGTTLTKGRCGLSWGVETVKQPFLSLESDQGQALQLRAGLLSMTGRLQDDDTPPAQVSTLDFNSAMSNMQTGTSQLFLPR